MKFFFLIFFCLILFYFSSCQNKNASNNTSTQTTYIYNKHTFDHRSDSFTNTSDSTMKHTSYYKHRYYQPIYPVKLETYENSFVDFQSFLAKHRYNSSFKPLIGVVTESQDDILSVNEFLVRIQKSVINEKHIRLITDEVLAKVVAYRNLKVGQTIPVPVINKSGKTKLVIYKVDTLFSLLGMPAFGLIPNKKAAAPILLFRGTDISPTLKGYSSVIADLDLNGPGATAFYATQDEIHSWLKKVSLKYPKARAIGYSLGGALTEYTCICEPDLLSKDIRFPNVAFNQPGVSEDFIYKWNQLKNEEKPILNGYITCGDLVSIVGKLIGNVKELSLEHPLEPLFAHVTLMSAQQRLYAYSIDVTLKNELDYSAEDKEVKKRFEPFSKESR